jgi:hypothetical protein
MRAAEAKIYLLVLLLLGGFLRFWFSDFKPIILDFDPFYHARIAETIYSDGSIPRWDPLELGGIPHYYSPGYHLLMVAGKYAAPNIDFITLGSILTVFFGVLGTILIYVMAAAEFGRGTALISVALYTLTPSVILRSGLVARPTGLSILLTILVLYALLKLCRKDNFKNRLVYFLALLGYILSHGSVVAVLAFILIAVLFLRANGKQVLIITALSASIGLIYYLPIIGELNFSTGITTESMPVFSVKDLFSPGQPLVLLTTLSVYGIVFLPLIFHGAYLFIKRSRKLWLLLTAFSLAMAFFKHSIFLLFIFTLFASLAASLSSIQNLRMKKIKAGWSLAAFIFISILMTDAYLLYSLQGVKVNSHVEPMQEFLSDIEFPDGAVILANDLNPGHEIAYYSNVSVFISDLSDIKKWDENHEIYMELFNERLSADEAIEILKTNKINYLLVIESSRDFPFMRDSQSSLILIKKNAYAALYLLKV